MLEGMLKAVHWVHHTVGYQAHLAEVVPRKQPPACHTSTRPHANRSETGTTRGPHWHMLQEDIAVTGTRHCGRARKCWHRTRWRGMNLQGFALLTGARLPAGGQTLVCPTALCHGLPLSVTWRALPLMYGGSLRWLLGLPCGLSCPCMKSR